MYSQFMMHGQKNIKFSISLLTSMTKLNFWANWILWGIVHFKFHVFSKMYGVKRKQKLKPLQLPHCVGM